MKLFNNYLHTYYVEYYLILRIKMLKTIKKANVLCLQKTYIYIYIYIYITENLWKTFWIKKRTKHVLKNISELQYKQKNPYNVKPRNSSQFSLLSSKKL